MLCGAAGRDGGGAALGNAKKNTHAAREQNFVAIYRRGCSERVVHF